MNCLIIIPDLASGSGSCCKAIAHELKRNGHKVCILTRYKTELFNLDIFGYLKKTQRQNRTIQSLKRVLTYPFWPFISFKEYKLILKNAEQILCDNIIDVVISVYNPIESIMAAHKLKIKYPKILFIPYFLDALLAGPTPKFMPLWLKKRNAIKFENRLLRNADKIIMMKAAENTYKENKNSIKNLEKIKFLDLPLFIPQHIAPIKHRKYFPENQKVFFFAGALPYNIRDPKYILDLFSKYKDTNSHLYIAGSGYYIKLVKYYSQQYKNIHYVGVIENHIVNEMYKEVDCLVNIGNSFSGMIPSKIFEYMSLNKMILSTIKIDNDPSVAYLEEYGKACLIDERIDLEKNRLKLLNFNYNEKNNIDIMSLFTLNQPSTFVNYIYAAFVEKN